MTKRLILFSFIFFLVSASLAAQESNEFRDLFNGKDLSGWDANPDYWTVKNGMIIGRSQESNPLKYNEFLIWKDGKVNNFELRVVLKVVGQNNSGVQYRSRLLPNIGKWVVAGYQCDIHPNHPFNAMVYEERGRGIIAQNGQSVMTDPKGRKWLVAERDSVVAEFGQFREYTIIAKGNHVIHKVDGKLTAEFEDYHKQARALSGLIAIQLHQGKPMEVTIKSVKLKKLADGGVKLFENAKLPSDAQEIIRKRPSAPAPKGKGKAKPAPKGKGAAPAKAKRPQSVGPRVGENKATPVDRIKTPPGFKVEMVYSVPGGAQGSWVALCNDDKGRIYASDQYGKLYRFNPPAPGEVLQQSKVETVPVKIRAINGMVFHKGALYAGVNDYEKIMQSGLYRITDSDGDDQLDKVELLRALDSKSDHGTHAVEPSPDGQSLYLITGNNTPITKVEKSSPVQPIWGDDHLLPRMPDGRGHNRHVLAPGGIIYEVSLDGKQFKAIASGFRNIYDASVNKDGEWFTYDADMEYDFNTPWYRPTRVNHVVSGADYGWRNGAGKYPDFYADNLPAAVDIGPGSPTGTLFGYGARWPQKYQQAFYIFDWSWGKIYAVHLKEKGASYVGVKEDFISGAPLPVTDAIIHPKDGAMYFAIGGRRVQSGLYRVSYVGNESTKPIDLKPSVSAARKLRHQLEAFHGVVDRKALTQAWPHLNHRDRFIRWAARVAIEHQPVEWWVEKAFAEPVGEKQLTALLALARVTGKCPSHRPENFVPFGVHRDRILRACVAIDFDRLSEEYQLLFVRLLQVTLHRFGDPDEQLKQLLVKQLDAVFPAKSYELNWLLCDTLVYLQAPNTARKGMELIAAADSQEPQMQFARSLRHLQQGWTPELRKQQLEWLLKAHNYRGGRSFAKFIEFIRKDSLATFTEKEQQQHAKLIAQKPVRKSAIENVGAIFAGRTPTMWSLKELSDAANDKEHGLKNRDFDRGKKMFSAAACYTCHRFGNAGGMNGPDLTGAGGRYNAHDLLDAILNPSKEINEQFAPIIVKKKDGSQLTGVVVNLSGDNVTLNTDLSDPDQRVNIDRKQVESIEVSKISPMPPMLLSMLKKDEILDLVAFTLSGGDQNNPMFKSAVKSQKQKQPAAK